MAQQSPPGSIHVGKFSYIHIYIYNLYTDPLKYAQFGFILFNTSDTKEIPSDLLAHRRVHLPSTDIKLIVSWLFPRLLVAGSCVFLVFLLRRSGSGLKTRIPALYSLFCSLSFVFIVSWMCTEAHLGHQWFQSTSFYQTMLRLLCIDQRLLYSRTNIRHSFTALWEGPGTLYFVASIRQEQNFSKRLEFTAHRQLLCSEMPFCSPRL